MSVPTRELLERDAELAAIESSLRATAAGEGGPLLIEGEAGAGKTALLEEGVRRAEALGIRTLRARGGEYEREFPYGVVRQLFEPALDRADGGVRLAGSAAMAAPAFEGTGAEDPFSIQHGLYWLVAELAESAPLLIAVDDAQWADTASLQALLYIGRRLEDIRSGLALTVRSGGDEHGLGAIAELRSEPRAVVLRPASFSVAAVTAFAAEESGRTPISEGFAAACREATGGNPFLLTELLRALDEEDDAFTAESPERLSRLAAGGASVAILSRLARLDELGADVARAVAILEPRAEVRLVAELSGHSADQVTGAAARLSSASLLADGSPLAFTHPLVREAVLREMGETAGRAAHARAARLLDEDGADLDAVAAHLLLSEPAGDEWVPARLREAAASAIGRGAPDAAVEYLRRAIAEPPAAGERTAIKRELGFVLLRRDDEEGIEILREVYSQANDSRESAEIAAVLSNSLYFRSRPAEAEAILSEALEENPGPGDRPGINLQLHLLLATMAGFPLPERLLPGPEDEIPTDSIEGRTILSSAALLYAIGMGPMSAVPRLAERIGLDAECERSDARAGYPRGPLLSALCLADRGEEAFSRFPEVLAGAEERGTLAGISGVHGARAFSHFCDGELAEAQADAETAIRISIEADFQTPLRSWLGAAARAMTARGEAEAAIALLDRHIAEGEAPPGIPGALALGGRGFARQAASLHAEACEDFLAAAERVDWIPWLNPEIGWRPGLAVSLAACGRAEEARQTAAECLELAEKAGGIRGMGVALRTKGLLAGGEEGIETLRASVDLLSETRAKLQYAESLVELGAALRRANRRKEAREPLAEGLEIAHRCGAAPLEERARTDLAAAGARPRNVVRSGIEALTPSELRVARLAAEGRTNREIAQTLVVSSKTIETHLRHVFQKLDIARRTELPDALDQKRDTSRFG